MTTLTQSDLDDLRQEAEQAIRTRYLWSLSAETLLALLDHIAQLQEENELSRAKIEKMICEKEGAVCIENYYDLLKEFGIPCVTHTPNCNYFISPFDALVGWKRETEAHIAQLQARVSDLEAALAGSRASAIEEAATVIEQFVVMDWNAGEKVLRKRPDGDVSNLAYAREIRALPAPTGTPAARWQEKGEPDPHGDRYKCERAKLACGDLTDDELANSVYMEAREPFLTAAKDRIRWLSRRCAQLTAERDEAIADNDDCHFEIAGKDTRIAELEAHASAQPYQARVDEWMHACFSSEICADIMERNHRFFEEAAELVQSLGMTASEAHQLVDYTWGRDIGEPEQEVGGVKVTLAALCLAANIDMKASAEAELARVWTKIETIRAKQAAKPKHSPLPQTAQPSAQFVAGMRVLKDIVRLQKDIQADVSTAHRLRGSGASEWMRDDDRDMRRELDAAFSAARAILAEAALKGEGK